MPLGKDVLLTGIPRSGTTLVCSILGEQSNVAALHEPIDPASFNGIREKQVAIDSVISSIVSCRNSIIDQGLAVSKQKDGQVPENSVEQAQGEMLRTEVTSLGTVRVFAHDADNLTLVLKHNALFTSLLPDIAESLPVFAIVRNPLAILASWQTVDFPVNRGRIPMGERFDPALGQKLDLLSGTLSRQLKVLDWFFARFRSYLERGRVITYEEVISTQGKVLSRIIGRAVESRSILNEQFYGGRLSSETLGLLRDALLTEPAIYEGFYSPEDINKLFDAEFS